MKFFPKSLTVVAWIVLCVTAAAQSGGQQLKVVEHIWGFDGRVQPGQFNPLSILLDNQTDSNVDAVLTLQRFESMLTVSGGQNVRSVFIAPSQRLWVQFYPYIPNERQTNWELTINDGEKSVDRKLSEFIQARSATEENADTEELRPQVVILDPADSGTRRPATVKHMPENIFPPYVSATVGLHTVFLDHVPDWELPRQQAFLSWLKLGGRLHLLQNGRGEFPRFSGDLAELNQPLNQYAIGSGIVVRHTIRRDALTADIVRRAIVVDSLKGADEEFLKAMKDAEKKSRQGLGQIIEADPGSIDNSIFEDMRQLTMPDHAWWLIFLLALCYVGLIFPGCFVVSKQKHLHFLTTYGAIVGLSVVFSILFLLIGRRGYGEATILQTLAVARAEDNSHWSVFQWNAFFVVSGDDYAATAPGQQVVFSIADNSDAVDAQVVPGNSGEVRMRIPPYSSQIFVSRRRVSSDDWKLSIAEADIQPSGIITLKINTGEAFPVTEDTKYMVIRERSISEMKYNAEHKQLTLFGSRRRIAEYCQPVYDFDYSRSWRAGQLEESETRSEEEIFFDEALPMLVQRCLMDDLVDRPTRFELPTDRIRLLVYTPVPEDFDISVSASAKRSGRILFTKDLFLQVGPAATQ